MTIIVVYVMVGWGLLPIVAILIENAIKKK